MRLSKAARFQVGRRGGRLADEYLAGAGRGREPSRCVHGISERGEVEALVLTDGADVRDARVDGGADGDPRIPALVPGLAQDLAGGLDRVRGMVGSREPGEEQRDDLVPDELVDDPVASVDGVRGHRVEARHEAGVLDRRRGGLGERGRPPHVGEEERDVHLGAAGTLLERVDAAAADAPVQPRGPEADEAHHVPGWPKRRVAELAPRVRGEGAGDPAHPWAPADVAARLAHEDGPPLLLVRSLLPPAHRRHLRSLVRDDTHGSARRVATGASRARAPRAAGRAPRPPRARGRARPRRRTPSSARRTGS